MKKVLSVFVAVAIVAALSLTAFAYTPSPVSVGEFNVRVDSYATGELGPGSYTVNEDGTISVTRVAESDYNYLGWKIYGEYEIVSGTLKSDTLTVRPLSDLRIVEMYDCPAAGAEDDDPVSPPTGNNLAAYAALSLLSLSVVIVAKKRLA